MLIRDSDHIQERWLALFFRRHWHAAMAPHAFILGLSTIKSPQHARSSIMQTANVQHLTLGAIVTLLPALLCGAPSSAVAQSAPPSYQGDPDVYKVIFEDENFRVIKSVRKKGEHDKPHSHPLPSVVYFLTDCPTRLYTPDGKTTDSTSKAGTARVAPVTQSHSAENIGSADCESLFVERK